MSNFVRILSVFSVLVVVMAIGTGVASASQPDGAGNDNGRGHETIISMPTRGVKDARDAHGARPGGGGSNLLAYRGGAVQTNTKVYISYWGWGTNEAAARTYVHDFFNNVGGSKWIGTDTEYCQGVASGSTDCSLALAVNRITNPAGQLTGEWDADSTAVPSKPTQTDIALAALRLQAKFGYDSNATYMVFTPSGKSMTGFGTQWCAWHSSTTTAGQPLAYAYIPYIPDAGASCGQSFVNAGAAGVFDGFSIVAGHEYEEAQTDPFPNGGWLDRNGAENADKCAWNSLSRNITLGGKLFAVQPVWSNKTGGCVTPVS